jgi:hypothetical protein
VGKAKRAHRSREEVGTARRAFAHPTIFYRIVSATRPIAWRSIKSRIARA